MAMLHYQIQFFFQAMKSVEKSFLTLFLNLSFAFHSMTLLLYQKQVHCLLGILLIRLYISVVLISLHHYDLLFQNFSRFYFNTYIFKHLNLSIILINIFMLIIKFPPIYSAQFLCLSSLMYYNKIKAQYKLRLRKLFILIYQLY